MAINTRTKYNNNHIIEIIAKEKQELEGILNIIKEREILAENINDSYAETLTFGQRIADKIASF